MNEFIDLFRPRMFLGGGYHDPEGQARNDWYATYEAATEAGQAALKIENTAFGSYEIEKRTFLSQSAPLPVDA